MMQLQPQPVGVSTLADAPSAARRGAILALDLGTTTGWALRAPTA